MTKLSKDKEIEKEAKILLGTFGENPSAVAVRLCEQAAFIKVTMDDLQEDVKTNGATYWGKDSNKEKVLKKNPAVDLYNVMVKNYNSIIKTLKGLGEEVPEEDALETFLDRA